MEKADIFWQTYLKLEKELLEISKFVFVTDEIIIENKPKPCLTQLEMFSPHLADLIVRTCIEIEAISKELYFDIGGKKIRGSKIFFDYDCLKLIDEKFQIHKKTVLISCLSFNLTYEENKSFMPFKDTHKNEKNDWNEAYQNLKHDRYSSIYLATIKTFIHAMGALYMLNIYYRKIKLFVKYSNFRNLDFSFGSDIFSIPPPSNEYILNAINNKPIPEILTSNDSLFILKYTNEAYTLIRHANKNSIEDKNTYLLNQPEIYESEFINTINEKSKRKEENFNYKFDFINELCKYRLNIKIPLNLPFEKRKELFIETYEWRGKIRQNNKHLNENELTELNIEAEIEEAGILAGMEIKSLFDTERLDKYFNGDFCEIVIDSGDVKYIINK